VNWFVDASVVVAITGQEEGWTALSDRLEECAGRLWSPISRWESVAGLRSRLRTDASTAHRLVSEFAAMNEFVMVAIGQVEADAALAAYERYGKGSAHPARLNMGDCFAYACAMTNGARLLYKGDDFSHTDLA
jgi:ribonuclease VapC